VRPASLVAIYVLFWVFSVFLVLPFGVRTTAEAGETHVPGQAESAPHEFRPGRIALRVTGLATMLFALFIANYHFGWLTAASLNYYD
jgi:predicted secreted protein